jgi:predicted TIM-barrel fold metal-dependent hydrolase
VIDHLPQMDPARARADLRELATRPQVVAKISQVLRCVEGRVPTDLAFYRERIDETFSLFGEDRVLYGSDWPNSDQWAAYSGVFNLVRTYFADKSPKSATSISTGTLSRFIGRKSDHQCRNPDPDPDQYGSGCTVTSAPGTIS